MSGPCYGFQSDPENIEVRIGVSTKVRGKPQPSVIIDDPLHDWTLSLAPESAKMRADFIEETATTNRCLRFAEDIRKIANKVEEQM